LDANAIGARIRELRGSATQKAFAELLGASLVSISRYESGERTPSAEFLVSISFKLGRRIDPIWLLTGYGAGPDKPVLTPREAWLLSHYRSVGDAGQRAIDTLAATLAGASPAPAPARGQHYHAPISGVAGRDIVSGGDVRIRNEGGRAKPSKK
jgi:transcriptional regulator with XRE-family HTH domain